MEIHNKRPIMHLHGRLKKTFARLDFQILLINTFPQSRGTGSVVVGFLFKSHGGSKITWGFGKAVGCAAFWWGIGGGMENVVGSFPWGLLEGGRYLAKKCS